MISVFKFLKKENPSNLKALSKNLSINPKSIICGDTKIKLAEGIKKNVSFITNIPPKYHKNIAKAVMRSIFGGGMADLVPYFKKYNGINAAEAHALAITQTVMAFSKLNEIKAKKLGIEKYEWLYSGAHCTEHSRLNGKIYFYSEPPIVDHKTGIRYNPGTYPGCHCKALPVINF